MYIFDIIQCTLVDKILCTLIDKIQCTLLTAYGNFLTLYGVLLSPGKVSRRNLEASDLSPEKVGR